MYLAVKFRDAILSKDIHQSRSIFEKKRSVAEEEASKLWRRTARLLLRLYPNLSAVTFHDTFDVKMFPVLYDSILLQNKWNLLI